MSSPLLYTHIFAAFVGYLEKSGWWLPFTMQDLKGIISHIEKLEEQNQSEHMWNICTSLASSNAYSCQSHVQGEKKLSVVKSDDV